MQLIRVDALKPGMVLGEDLYGSEGELLLAKGQELTAQHIVRLASSVFEMVAIYGDEEDEMDSPPATKIIGETLRRNTAWALTSFYKAIHTEQKKSAQLFQQLKLHLEEIIDEILRNQEIVINIANLKHYDDYTYQHSVNVAIICIAVGASMDMSRAALSRLGMGALLHDIGKIFIPKEIIRKPGRLDLKELEEVKQHTVLGYKYLSQNWDVPMEALIGALSHHERCDGSGYPYGLRRDKLPQEAKLIAICDVYDAMTSERPYRKALSPSEAMEHIIGNSGILYDEKLIESFFKKIEPYPVGTPVILSNGYRGRVVKNHMNALIRPVVAVGDSEAERQCLDLLNDPRLWDVTIIGVDRKTSQESDPA